MESADVGAPVQPDKGHGEPQTARPLAPQGEQALRLKETTAEFQIAGRGGSDSVRGTEDGVGGDSDGRAERCRGGGGIAVGLIGDVVTVREAQAQWPRYVL